MNKAAYGRPLFVTLAIVSMLLLIVGTVTAKEQQLAGVRLNDHAIDLLDVYGPPDGLVTGPSGSPFPQVGLMAGAGMMPGGPMGAGMPRPGASSLAARLGALGAGGGGLAGGAFAPAGGAIGAAGPRGTGMFPGAPGAAGQASVVPNWALPVYIDTLPGEIMWIYQRGPITLGFLLDLDGYVQDIAVAADECDYVRTADWRPHKYVKLGDYYSRVMQRYGWPDETNTYTASGPGGGGNGVGGAIAGASSLGARLGALGAGGGLAGGAFAPAGGAIGAAAMGGGAGGGAAAPSVSFSGISKTFSRDCVMRYTEDGDNIDFTLHDFRVVRIHIWD